MGHDLLTSAQRASKIHHLPDEATSLDIAGDADLFVIDRRDANGNWLNHKLTATNLAAQLSSAIVTPVPAEDSVQDGQAIEYFDDYALGSISAFDQGTGWLSDGVGSGCSIVSRTTADGRAHNRLSISNGQYGRPMPWGDKWNRVKIVLLWRINHTATMTPGDGYIGICSGTTNMVASATTANYIGARWSDGLSSITFTAGTRINYFNMGSAFRFWSRRGTTSTSIGAGGSGHTLSAAEGYITAFVVEISRPPFATDASSVLYTIKEASPPASLVESSRSKDLIKGLLSSSAGTAASMSELETAVIGSTGNATGAFDQSTGILDTVNISWAQVPGLEIAALAVRKVH